MLPPQQIMLLADIAAPAEVIDLNTGQPPTFYRGSDIAIGIGIAQYGAILPSDNAWLARIASVTLQLFASENDANGPMMAADVLAASMNLALTQVQWTNESAAAHAIFVFANSLTAIDLGGRASRNYWLRIIANTSDDPPQITPLIEGTIIVRDGPVSTLSPPTLGGARFFTVGGNVVFQILDPNTGLYHTLSCYSDAGVMTLQISDTGY